MTTPPKTMLSTTDSAIDLNYDSSHPTASRSNSNTDKLTNFANFGQKLGYTLSQVSRALDKLGGDPSQNELLGELINLDGGEISGGSLVDNGAVGGSLVGEDLGKGGGEELRHVVVDGSNVAMSAGNNSIFSTSGLQDCADYFLSRGHPLTIFLPSFRRDPLDNFLLSLEKSGHLVYTPSRTEQKSGAREKRTICYDDRFILKLALETDGIVVSNDGYRDLIGEEGGTFRKVVEERVLMFSFVRGRFTPPSDPLGRSGPSLHQFLRKSSSPPLPPCPYQRKCTYGSKCKYYHPFTTPSVSDTLRKQAAKTQSVPLSRTTPPTLTRTRSEGKTMETKTIEIRPHKKLERQLSINPYGWESFKELPPFPGEQNPLNKVWGRGAGEIVGQEGAAVGVVGDGGEREKMRYHLMGLFEERKVDHVLQLHPTSTDATFICSEIVRIFK